MNIRFKHILRTVLLLLLVACPAMLSAQAKSTEGRDFRMVFMANRQMQSAIETSLKAELHLIAKDRVLVHVKDFNNSEVTGSPFQLEPGIEVIVDLPVSTCYLDPPAASGVPTVYSTSISAYTDDNHSFSCFGFLVGGTGNNISSDAFLVLPTENLGKEYMVQTNPNSSSYATQFAVVAIEDQTEVTINIPNGQSATSSTAQILNKGQTLYMTSLFPTEEESYDLTGSIICASKQVAVFVGNQAAKIPENSAFSDAVMQEQIQPATQLSNDFYFAIAGQTQYNYPIITAIQDNTVITATRYSSLGEPNNTTSFALQMGESTPWESLELGETYDDEGDYVGTYDCIEIHASNPVIAMNYLTCGAVNQSQQVAWGNPANCFIVSPAQQISDIHFVSRQLDLVRKGTTMYPQKHYVQLVIPVSDKGKVSVDNTIIPSSNYRDIGSNYAYVNYQLNINAGHSHHVSTTGRGFTGFVHGMTNGQAYMYALGYCPSTQDSLFVREPKKMQDSYDLERMEDGYYARQDQDYESYQAYKPDTAIVCDRTELTMTTKVSNPAHWDSIHHRIYRLDYFSGFRQKIVDMDTTITEMNSTTLPDNKLDLRHFFEIPAQKNLLPSSRSPYELFLTEQIFYPRTYLCELGKQKPDTIQLIVQVNRTYNDTIYQRVICRGDSIKAFFDTKNKDAEDYYHVDPIVANDDVSTFYGDFLGDSLVTRKYHTIRDCDSTMMLYFAVCDTFYTTLVDTICEEDTLKIPGLFSHTVLTQTGIYYDTLKTHGCDEYRRIDPTFMGCDSIFELRLTVNPISRDTTFAEICAVQSYTWQDRRYVGPEFEDRQPTDIVLDWDHNPLLDSLVYQRAQTGCDSTRYLLIQVNSNYHNNLTPIHTCQGDSPIYHDFRMDEFCIEYQRVGKYTYTDTLPSEMGCDSVVTLTIFVDSIYRYNEVDTTCFNSTYEWTSHRELSWDTPGEHIYYDSLQSIYGCDSIYTLRLMVLPSYDQTDTRTISDHGFVTWEGLTIAGEFYQGALTPDYVITDDTVITVSYQASAVGSHRCDSIRHLQITLGSTYVFETKDYICQSEPSYTWYLRDYTTATPKEIVLSGTQLPMVGHDSTYVDSLKTELGYDSVFVLHLFVSPEYFFSATDSVCQSEGDTYIWRGQEIDRSTVGVTTLTDGLKTKNYACDSIYTITVTVLPSYHFHEMDTICDNDSLRWHGRMYRDLTPGLHYDTLPGITTNNCDSTYYLALTVLPSYFEVASGDSTVINLCANETTLAVGRYEKQDTISTVLGCDSVVSTVTYVWPTFLYQQSAHARQDRSGEERYTWRDEFGNVHGIYSLANTGTFYLEDKQQTIHGCDSIFQMTLTVDSTYQYDSIYSICENERIIWQGRRYTGDSCLIESGDTIILAPGTYYDTIRYMASTGCDSTFYLVLHVYPTYYVEEPVAICENEQNWTYIWNQTDSHGAYSHLLTFDHIEAEDAEGTIKHDKHLSLTDTLHTIHGCDSVVTLRLTVHPIYLFTQDTHVCQDTTNAAWPWIDEQGGNHGTFDIRHAGEIVRGDTMHTQFDCDSIFGIRLIIDSTYRYDSTYVICENERITWQGRRYTGDSCLIESNDTIILAPGTYYDTVHYTAVTGCDSTYYLVLHVYPTYYVQEPVAICENEQNWTYIWNQTDSHGAYSHLLTFPHIAAEDPEGTIKHDLHMSLTDTLHSVYGCDSVVNLQLTIHPIYLFMQDMHVCQDTTNAAWPWIDEQGGNHGTFDIRHAGEIVQGDTLHTHFGCDSIFGIRLIVDSTYRYDSTYVICENERITWQGRRYTADSCIIESNDTIILAPGTYYDTAHYTAVTGCDSTYYLVLHVNPIYDTTEVVDDCAQDDWIWVQHDHLGSYLDTIWTAFYDTTYLLADSALNPQAYIEDRHFVSERMLRTIHDCDSMTHLRLTIHPSYLYRTDTTICTNERVSWRGKTYFGRDSLYREVYQTTHGCDSVYELHVYVKPVFTFAIHDTICSNQTLCRYTRDGKVEQIVWAPGMTIPQEGDWIDISYTSDLYGCDSIYRYFLVIHPASLQADTMDVHICGTEPYHFVTTTTDEWYNTQGEWCPTDSRVHEHILSGISENILGCDSAVVHRVFVHPSYHFHQDSIVCQSNLPMIWTDSWGRDHGTLDISQTGHYEYIEYLKTVQANCDSIYSISLDVAPTYQHYDTLEAKPLHTVTWQGMTLQANYRAPLDTFITYETSLHGCDSTFYLHVYVADTTMHTFVDTLCLGDVYTYAYIDYYSRQPMTFTATESGTYQVVGVNEMNREDFVTLQVTFLIPPMVRISDNEAICVDYTHLSYSLHLEVLNGLRPDWITIVYDSALHAQGVQDVSMMPVTYADELTREADLTIPLLYEHYVDSSYIRPDNYTVRIYYVNEHCLDTTLSVDDIQLTFNYPSWILEQHYDDVIALLKDNNPSGTSYSFSDFQWYHDGRRMPGETGSYLYIPTGLGQDEHYSARLTRVGEQQNFMTCEMTSTLSRHVQSEQYDFMSVTPTLVSADNPTVYIVTSGVSGDFSIYTAQGQLVGAGIFNVDSHNAFPLRMPGATGVYLIRLHSEGAVYERDRTVRVVVH